ncbi:hypothetical protein Tco_0522582 [Tanacetum coccineum]
MLGLSFNFSKYSSIWGELFELKMGKVFWARAKELFVWSSSFKDVPEKELFLDDESAKINEQANNLNNDEVENASEVVSDTYFGDNGEVHGFRASTCIPYPPGFTPANDIPACNNQDIPEAESVRPPGRSARSNSRVLERGRKTPWTESSSESFSMGFFLIISSICLDRHLSDHRPILLKEIFSDFGLTPFRFYHSWLELPGFDDLVSKSWNSFTLDDSNGMIRFKKKLQMLKKEIRAWTLDFKRHQPFICLVGSLETITDDVQSSNINNRDIMQKAKIRWAIEGDENSKYFHAIINKKRANLSVKGIMVDGDWIVEPDLVKQEFRRALLTDRFQDPGSRRGSLNFPFPNRLNNDQILELESLISNEDIRTAVWGCGVDKSPGPDGFTFEFFRKYWTVVGPDFCIAVKWFFDHGDFAIGCNSSFVALIPKVLDPKDNFFNGFQEGDRKIAWVKWSKVLASKKFGGLGVSSFFALNRALLFKWVWRYLSHDNSLWSPNYQLYMALNGHVFHSCFQFDMELHP